jgi:uncharacterized protein with FMN-binding domain
MQEGKGEKMKRAILIGVGTVGGLGAVMTITPPQFGHSGLTLGSLPSTTSTTATNPTSSTSTTSSAATTATTSQTSTPVSTKPATTATTTKTTKKATKKATKKKKTKKKATTASTTTATSASTSTAATTTGVSGTFTGDVAQTFYGGVQVQITISNNKIVSAKALQYPTESFRDQAINSQAIPYLEQETLQAQSANIQGVGGASYTSQGWQSSLQSALQKAGL